MRFHQFDKENFSIINIFYFDELDIIIFKKNWVTEKKNNMIDDINRNENKVNNNKSYTEKDYVIGWDKFLSIKNYTSMTKIENT